VFYLLSKCILYFVFQLHFSVYYLYLKYNLGQTENKPNLPAMNGCTIFLSSTTGCTIQNLWVKEQILVFIYCSHVRLNVHYQITEKTVYRSANAIFGNIGLIVSEDVILQLIKSTCII